MNKKILEEKIVAELKQVFDPEIPVNIYDIGLIYEIHLDDRFNARIVMTLTSPNCPVAESLPVEVKERLEGIDGIGTVEIELTFEPPWDQDMLSEEARLELGLI